MLKKDRTFKYLYYRAKVASVKRFAAFSSVSLTKMHGSGSRR